MKFKFKLSSLLLGLATFLAIVLSIVLWIFIMTNDQRFDHLNQSQNRQEVAEQQMKVRSKSLYDLYLPTNTYGFKNGKAYHLYDSNHNLPFEFSRDLRKGRVTKIKLVARDAANYRQLINNPAFLQMAYPNQITTDLFANMRVRKKNCQFNRFFIPASNKWLYLGNDQNNHVYRIKVSGVSFKRLRRYARRAHYQTQVEFVRLHDGYSAFYVRDNSWQIYSYLINHQPPSYFVNRLLGTSGVSSRNSKTGRTTYALGYNTRLRVPASGQENDHNYLYTHFEKNARHIPLTRRLLNSIYYVHRLGLMEQNLRFFDEDDEGVSYNSSIEGIPVFLNQHNTQVNVDFAPAVVTVHFNSTNFQIPVPFDGRTTTLPPTAQVVANLEQHGLRQSDLDRIEIGFKIERDKSHNSLINLVPAYYVKAFGQWKSAADWKKQDLAQFSKINENEEKEGN